jgi:predicted kinase
MLLIIFGEIGVGKSSLAKTLASSLAFHLIQFDPLVPTVTGKEKMYGDDGEFLLSDDDVEKVHAKMRNLAEQSLKEDRHVIVESMYFKKQRDQIIALAEKMKVPYHLIEVVCDDKEVRTRIAKRLSENMQSANVELFLENRGFLKDEKRVHLIIDTTGKTFEECTREVIQELGLKRAGRLGTTAH